MAVDPRLRERRNAVQRALGRRRLRRLGWAVVAVLVPVLAAAALFTPLLDVDTVHVTGASQTGETAVLSALGFGPGKAMVLVDSQAAAEAVERLPWVERAAVERDWPGTVTVAVEERRPSVAVLGADGRFTLIDRAGRELATVDQPAAGLPVLEGVAIEPRPGTVLEEAEGALAVVAALPPLLAARVVRVAVRPDGIALAVRAEGDAQAEVVLGPPTELPAKVLALATLLDEADLVHLKTIDLRVPAAPVLTRG